MNRIKGLLLYIIVWVLDRSLFKEDKMERFQARQWIVNLLLLGAVMMLLATALNAQTVKATKVLNLSVGGRTLCENGEIVVEVNAAIPHEEVAEVMFHEAVHVLQLRKFPRCEDGVERYKRDKRFALEMELEAYCLSARYLAPDRNIFLAMVDFIASYLWRTNHANFNTYEGFKVFVVSGCNRQDGNIPVIRFISSEGPVALFDISPRSAPVQQDGTRTRPP